LLKKGAYINVQDHKGETPLSLAAKGGHIEIVQALLDKFADVYVEGEDSKTALYWAVDKNQIAVSSMIRGTLTG
jgi:ankyrin repeat protein